MTAKCCSKIWIVLIPQLAELQVRMQVQLLYKDVKLSINSLWLYRGFILQGPQLLSLCVSNIPIIVLIFLKLPSFTSNRAQPWICNPDSKKKDRGNVRATRLLLRIQLQDSIHHIHFLSHWLELNHKVTFGYKWGWKTGS